jgi:hypothetical protein
VAIGVGWTRTHVRVGGATHRWSPGLDLVGDQVQQHRDGVTVDASGLSPLLRALGKMIPSSGSSNDAYWLAGTRDRQLPSASGFAVLLVRDATDVVQRLTAGRIYQRLHLGPPCEAWRCNRPTRSWNALSENATPPGPGRSPLALPVWSPTPPGIP